MKDTFDIWMNRAFFFLGLWTLPMKLTQKSRPEVHLLGILIEVPWAILTLPIQLFLVIPALICMMMSIRHIT